MKRLSSALLTVLVATILGWPALAQEPRVGSGSAPIVGIEVLKPHFAASDFYSYGFLNGATFLTASVPLGGNLRLAADVPIVHLDITFDRNYGWYAPPDADGSISRTQLGNPYIGLELESGGTGMSVAFGVRLPLARRTDDWFGGHSGRQIDPDRSEAFGAGQLSVLIMAYAVHEIAEGLGLSFHAGPTSSMRLGGRGYEDESLLIMRYGARVFYRAGPTEIGVDGTGRVGFWAFEPVNVLGLGVQLDLGRVQPGVHFRVPIDLEDFYGYGHGVDYVVGVNVAVRI
jgi:hypothetical protein